MSVSWGVIPLDSTLPEYVDWLEQKGIAVPDAVGRYPTLDELTQTLAIFDGQPFNIEHAVDDLWEVTVGVLYSDCYVHMLGSVREDGSYDFHFWGSGCQETTMITILKHLSSVCGPFVWCEDETAFPMLITPDIEVEMALHEWRQRWEARRNSSDTG